MSLFSTQPTEAELELRSCEAELAKLREATQDALTELTNRLTTAQVAKRLGLTKGRVWQLVRDGSLSPTKATPTECAALLSSGTIRAVPPSGVYLYDPDEVDALRGRREK